MWALGQQTRGQNMAHASGRLDLDRAAVYRIQVQGELDQGWADWFREGQRVSEIDISAHCGVTTLTGTVADQPALYGLLVKLRDLSLALLSVDRVEVTGPVT
jgi:hypothetical protein